MAIYEIHVTKEQLENAKKRIKEIEKENNGYNIAGLLLAYFKIKLHRNKYYCSEFVYEVLSSDGVEIIERDDKIFHELEIEDSFFYENLTNFKGENKSEKVSKKDQKLLEYLKAPNDNTVLIFTLN